MLYVVFLTDLNVSIIEDEIVRILRVIYSLIEMALAETNKSIRSLIAFITNYKANSC